MEKQSDCVGQLSKISSSDISIVQLKKVGVNENDLTGTTHAAIYLRLTVLFVNIIMLHDLVMLCACLLGFRRIQEMGLA